MSYLDVSLWVGALGGGAAGDAAAAGGDAGRDCRHGAGHEEGLQTRQRKTRPHFFIFSDGEGQESTR